MKKGVTMAISIFPILWMICCVLPVWGTEKDEPPENIVLEYLHELYEPVSFDHQTHAEMYDCSSCHHHTTGGGTEQVTCKKCHSSSQPSEVVSCSACHQYGKVDSSPPAVLLYHIDKPGLKGALHLQCLGCHHDEGGPTGCLECHDFTAAGRERFALKN